MHDENKNKRKRTSRSFDRYSMLSFTTAHLNLHSNLVVLFLLCVSAPRKPLRRFNTNPIALVQVDGVLACDDVS
jgi:hypothetical protein